LIRDTDYTKKNAENENIIVVDTLDRMTKFKKISDETKQQLKVEKFVRDHTFEDKE